MTTNISEIELNRTRTLMDLESILGPVRQELYNVIPMTLIYCAIFLTGMIGNVSTCIVIACNKYMQTSTNYYLLNLAVSDLLVLLLGLPQETYSFWSAYPWLFGETFCVMRTLAAETSTNSSVLTITAFSVERYVAICHPVLKCPTLSSLHRAIKMIVIVWSISCICSLPIVVQYGVVYIHDNTTGLPIPESATCNIRPDRYVRHAFELSSFLFFVVPVTLISVLYGLIGLAIRRTSLKRTWSDMQSRPESRRNCDSQSTVRGQLRSRSMLGDKVEKLNSPVLKSRTEASGIRIQQNTKARVAALKMLVAVVVAFVICWAPFHIQRLMSVYVTDSRSNTLLNVILFYTSGILFYVSSVINPILYNVMSLKFRRAFKNTLLPNNRRQLRMRKKKKADDRIVVDKQMPYRFSLPIGPAPQAAGGGGSQNSKPPSVSQHSEIVRDPIDLARPHRVSSDMRIRDNPGWIVEPPAGSSKGSGGCWSSSDRWNKLRHSCDQHASQRRSPAIRIEQRPYSSYV